MSGEIKKVVTEETAKQTVIFLFGLLSVLAAAGIMNSASKYDWKTFKMATALDLQNFCQR